MWNRQNIRRQTGEFKKESKFRNIIKDIRWLGNEFIRIVGFSGAGINTSPSPYPSFFVGEGEKQTCHYEARSAVVILCKPNRNVIMSESEEAHNRKVMRFFG